MDKEKITRELLEIADEIQGQVTDPEYEAIYDVSDIIYKELMRMPRFMKVLAAYANRAVYKSNYNVDRVLAGFRKNYDQIVYDVSNALNGKKEFWIFPAGVGVRNPNLAPLLRKMTEAEAGNINTEWQWFIKELGEHTSDLKKLWQKATAIAEMRAEKGDIYVHPDAVDWMIEASRK